ncbi:MAG: hypothetical protein A2076_06655 [Geobacteraceae bacterium GWC2_53_11]|nr:MAG: hypothetical protein A2076_06655 [Geobacteraceae bacterium GWC2_53_11]
MKGSKKGKTRGLYTKYTVEQRISALDQLRRGEPVENVSILTKINRGTLYSWKKASNITTATVSDGEKSFALFAYDVLVLKYYNHKYAKNIIVDLIKEKYKNQSGYVLGKAKQFGLLENLSVKEYVKSKYGDSGCDWYQNGYKTILSKSRRNEETVWFLMLDEIKFNFPKLRNFSFEKSSSIRRIIVRIMGPGGENSQFWCLKTGVSAAKIIDITNYLLGISSGSIRVVILDNRIEKYSTLKKSYSMIEIEMPFIEKHKYENWLSNNISSKKERAIRRMYEACGDIREVAKMFDTQRGIIKRICE